MLVQNFSLLNFQEIEILLTEALAAMSIWEVVAVLFGLTYVILAAVENIWCWAAALVSVSIYIYLCLEASLYAETGLQVFYLIMAVVGWWSWTKKKKKKTALPEAGKPQESKDTLPIQTWPLQRHLVIILVNTAGTILLAWLLDAYTSAANPYLDSFTTVFSLFTTYMVTQKVLENWLYWIVIDTASIFLYASRDLYLTALLFLLYTIIAIVGYFKWHREFKLEKLEPEAKW